jgi:Domain of unknown function (DUF5122) beta-propeller
MSGVRPGRPAYAILVVSIVTVVGLIAHDASATTQVPSAPWGVRGKVYALKRGPNGSRIYVGGKFGALTESDGATSSPASSLTAVNTSTGLVSTSFRPSFTYQGLPGTVKTVAVSPDGTVVYAGGQFDAVNGQPAKNLAAVAASDGHLVSTFATPTLNQVNTILVNPTTGELYIGGSFSRVNEKRRGNLAALFPDGTLDPDWAPVADDVVRKMRFSSDRQTIFVAGHFTTIDGQSRQSVARLNVDGTLDDWAIPDGTVVGPMTAWDLIGTPTRLFVGFGQDRNYVAAFRLDDGAVGDVVWLRHTPGNVESVALSSDHSTLFFGGHFGTSAGSQTCGSYELHGLASADAETGVIDCGWLPHLYPDSDNYTGAWTMMVDPQYKKLWVGGFFTQICHEAGTPCARQHSLARFGL